MKTFRTFCGLSGGETDCPDSLTEAITINPGVAKAAAVGILFKIKQSIQKVEGADAKVLSNQLFLLATMIGVAIATLTDGQTR
jgi:hypothetical protein